jgi:hypothetical protein
MKINPIVNYQFHVFDENFFNIKKKNFQTEEIIFFWNQKNKFV